jgi:PAS domain-containing protein
MGLWEFDDATEAMADTTEVLDERDRLDARAAELGLERPADLRDAFEAATGGFDDAVAIIDGEDEALEAIEAAIVMLGAERDLFTQIGLLDEQPEVELDAARAAYERSEPDDAVAAAAAAEAIVTGAADTGRTWVFTAAGILVGSFLVTVIVIVAVGRLRRRRDAAAFVAPAGSPDPTGVAFATPAVGPDAAGLVGHDGAPALGASAGPDDPPWTSPGVAPAPAGDAPEPAAPVPPVGPLPAGPGSGGEPYATLPPDRPPFEPDVAVQPQDGPR